MGKIKKYKNVVERFLSGDSGQRFFNFAYSIGAAVVIWGALFKILHLQGGNELLTARASWWAPGQQAPPLPSRSKRPR